MITASITPVHIHLHIHLSLHWTRNRAACKRVHPQLPKQNNQMVSSLQIFQFRSQRISELLVHFSVGFAISPVLGMPSEFCSFSVWVEVRGAILIAFEKSGSPCPDRLTLPARAASQIRLKSMHALGSTHLHIEAQREISTTFTKAADCLSLFSNSLQIPHVYRQSQTKR